MKPRFNKLAKIVFLAIAICVLYLFAAAVLPATEYTLTIKAGRLTYEFYYPEIDLSGGMLYLKDIDNVISRIAMDVATPQSDAKIIFDPNAKDKFTIIEGQRGKRLDEKQLRVDVAAALIKKTSFINAVIVDVPPAVTAEILAASTCKRGEFCTFYGTSTPERKQNIRLAADSINGTVLCPGEQFSFNQTVGERTPERGYQQAKIILGGVYTDGYGGGVCQVSSTLYNCALLADLVIDERHTHSICASYVQPSFDAMVSDGSFDLKFTNTTDGWIFIEAKADGERLTTVFYGLKNRFDIKRVSKTLLTKDNGYDVLPDDEGVLSPGEDERIIAYTHPAVESKGYLEYYQNGQLIKTVDLGTDKYKGTKGQIVKRLPQAPAIIQ